MNIRAFPGFLAILLGATVALAGCDKAKGDPANATAAPASAEPVAPGARRIDITASNEGYSPATVDVKKGETVVLRFKRTTKSDCLAELKIPKLAVKKELPIDQPVEIAVTPNEAGDIPFSCGMDMVHGKIHVTGS
jgi:plastocyanin domain-containing protein